MKNKLILIAVGANLPRAAGMDPLETCLWALGALSGIEGIRLKANSRWYRTAAIPSSDQPLYVNGVVAMEGDPDPAALLSRLHEIEAEAGRVRSVPNAARTLDLDLLAVGDEIVPPSAIDPASLVLPHPRMQDRRFVLLPLNEVAPNWKHPASGATAGEMLAALPPQLIWLR